MRATVPLPTATLCHLLQKLIHLSSFFQTETANVLSSLKNKTELKALDGKVTETQSNVPAEGKPLCFSGFHVPRYTFLATAPIIPPTSAVFF